METPASLKQRIADYYRVTTEASYLNSWAGESLGIHFGIADEKTRSLDESLRNANRYLADRGHIGADDRVLDAGCGVGGSSIWLAKERGCEVVGVTVAPNQVELARRFAVERGVAERVSFACADYLSTGFPAASFDVVWNLESMCHAADVGAYATHVFDLLRDRGRWVILDLFRGEQGDPDHCRAMCEGWVLPSLRTREQAASALAAAGFSEIESVDVTSKVLRSAIELHRIAGARLELLQKEPSPDPIYLGHTTAALGAVEGMLTGSVTYGFVGGVRPAR